jgi:hypothetical protein
MKDTLTPSNLALFALFVLPGLISMAVYRLRMPARLPDWGSALVQGLFYSSLNYVLLLPAIILIHRNGYPELHPWRYWGGVLLMVFAAPAIWPILLVWAYRLPRIAKLIQVPYPTTWDYVFRSREAEFVLLRLTDGRFIGGYWGPGSYAGAHPNEGDIFISAVYQVDETGKFGTPVPHSAGLHIRKDSYTSIEFFKVPALQEPPLNFDQ